MRRSEASHPRISRSGFDRECASLSWCCKGSVQFVSLVHLRADETSVPGADEKIEFTYVLGLVLRLFFKKTFT